MAQDGKDDRRVKRSRLAFRPPLGEASAHSVTHGSGRDVERLDRITRTFCEDLLRGRSVRVTIVTDRAGLRRRWHQRVDPAIRCASRDAAARNDDGPPVAGLGQPSVLLTHAIERVDDGVDTPDRLLQRAKVGRHHGL